jgi:hypothetical protein
MIPPAKARSDPRRMLHLVKQLPRPQDSSLSDPSARC